MVVYVINVNGKPLMPCSPVIARLLLKQEKAQVKHRTPFTIKLLYKTKTEYIQPLVLGIDPGSRKLGSAVVDIEHGNVFYMSQVELRDDITRKMNRRAKYRRNRRNRKTRYRKPRFLNRRNLFKKNRFSPTLTSKISGHLREIKYVKGILPISNIIIETATFDPHALKNPVVLKKKWLYQKGINYEFENIKAYVLHRDKYTCWQCKGKSKDKRLCCHHIIYRKNDGSNEPENLITMCQTCHKTLHNSPKVIQDKVRNKLHGKRKKQLNHATQMNNIQSQLLKRVKVTETFGYITKAYRQYLKLSKEHYYDAVAIANQFGTTIEFKTEVVLFKKCVAVGDYQQTKGIRSQQRLTTCKICGFRKFDKVKYKGREYLIKGRMSTGYAILMNIDGQTLQFKPLPKFIQLGRISARGSLIMIEKPREMPN